jgi:glycosyltransferase involved in cell wall biosynthesis
VGDLEGRKIVILIEAFIAGGAERQVVLLATRLQDHYRATVEVWAHQRCDDPHGLRAELEARGIATKCIPITYGRAFRYVPGLLRLARAFSHSRPDALIAELTGPAVSVGLLWRFTSARTALWVQQDEGLWRLPRYQEIVAARLMPTFVAVSDSVASFVAQTYARGGRVVVIRNGVGVPKTDGDARDWRSIIGDRVAVVMVANLTTAKDHPTVVKAWATVKSQHPETVLLLAGYLGDTATDVKAQIARLGLTEDIVLLGHVPDVPSLLAQCQIGVLSSRSEGFSVAALEYLASALPVVGTDTPGIRVALGPDLGQLLVRPGDAEAMASKIVALLRDDSLRERLGAEARVRARHFSINQTAAKYVELIER